MTTNPWAWRDDMVVLWAALSVHLPHLVDPMEVQHVGRSTIQRVKQ